MIDRDLLRRWREVTDAAEKGQWKVIPVATTYALVADDPSAETRANIGLVGDGLTGPNGAFVLTAREAMPLLLDAAEDLHKRKLSDDDRRLVRDALLEAAERTAEARVAVEVIAPPEGAASFRQRRLAELDRLEGQQRRLASEFNDPRVDVIVDTQKGSFS